MPNYQQAYLKLFNTLTDLTEETKRLTARMESAQSQCEEIIIASGGEIILFDKTEEP